MYASRSTQLMVGIFGLIGIAFLAILSFRLGSVSILPTPGYVLFADFDNIAGLKSGDQVEIAGVQVGKVVGIRLKDNRAQVKMQIDQGVEVDDEAIASVFSSGIIGGKYLSIALGPGERMLHNGGRIRQTQSAFQLENAIGQLINNFGSGGSKSEDKDGKPDDKQNKSEGKEKK